MNEYELWWSSLPIKEKERIARKGIEKSSKGADIAPESYRYPACTVWWESLTDARKFRIFDHCVNRHGLELRDWDEANPYGD